MNYSSASQIAKDYRRIIQEILNISKCINFQDTFIFNLAVFTVGVIKARIDDMRNVIKDNGNCVIWSCYSSDSCTGLDELTLLDHHVLMPSAKITKSLVFTKIFLHLYHWKNGSCSSLKLSGKLSMWLWMWWSLNHFHVRFIKLFPNIRHKVFIITYVFSQKCCFPKMFA